MTDTFFVGKSVIEKKKIIRENEWFRELYPICELEKYKVIFMTTKKFFLPMNTFFKMPFYMYLDDIIKNSVIFIDEFDSSKKDVLNVIIDDALKINKIAYPRLNAKP